MDSNSLYAVFVITGCTMEAAPTVQKALSSLAGFHELNLLDRASNTWCATFTRAEVAHLTDEALDAVVTMRLGQFPELRVKRSKFS